MESSIRIQEGRELDEGGRMGAAIELSFAGRTDDNGRPTGSVEGRVRRVASSWGADGRILGVPAYYPWTSRRALTEDRVR